MSQPAHKLAPVDDVKPPLNQAIVKGRITEVRRNGDTTYTCITMPAADEYSHPTTVEVVSTRMLGKPGADIEAHVELRGYRRKFKTKQGEDAYQVTNILSLVE